MGISRFFGKEGKKAETTFAQPAGSRTSQFFHDENITAASGGFPASSSRFPIKSLAPPTHAPPPIPDTPYVSTWDTPAPSRQLPIKSLAPPTNASFFSNTYSPTVSTRGGDSSWDPHTPSADLPARKRSKFPWRKSVGPTGPADPVVGEARMSGYFPPADSSRSSVIDTGTDGATPGSFQFSDASPASDVTSPPTSPFTFGNPRRKPFGLRPTASSPNLHASADSTPSFVSPSRHAKNASTLSSLYESPATSRPRRGSDSEPASTLSPFANARDSMEREQAPRRFGRRKAPTRAARDDDEQLRNDAQEIIDVELAMAMSESLALHNASKSRERTPSPQPPAAAVWRNPSPVSSDLSDDMDLYSGRDDTQPSRTRRSNQRAAGPEILSAQELADLELAHIMQREEEERAMLAQEPQASSSRSPPGSYSYQPPGFHYPVSTQPRERRPYGPFAANPFADAPSANNPFAASRTASNPFAAPPPASTPFNGTTTARSVSNPEPAVNPFTIPPAATFNAPPAAAIPNNPFARPKSPPETIDPDELLARQLQEEENQGPPRHVTGPQVDNDMALAMQLAKEEDDRRREVTSTPKTRVCVVCGDASPIPELPSLMNCAHEPQVCKDCYQGWIGSELNGKSWKEIKCPQEGCKELLHHAEVQAFATPEVYAKFDQLSAREALSEDPDFRWCKGPNCDSGQIHENHVSGNIFVCIACGFKLCTVHEGKWHEGETCEEYDYRTSGRQEADQKRANELSEAAINQLTKACPGKKGKCGWKIEKNDGCDHMTCIKCKHQFCWMCMQDYKAILDQGNDKHLPSCNYHPSKLPDLPPEQAA